MKINEDEDWPRIRDLPEEERAPFQKFLVGQTRPYNPKLGKESDCYFPWDYANFKRPPNRRYFD